MRITIIYRYFRPDTPPYALMLGEMVRWFQEDGHEVEVITAQPAYKPELNIPKQPWSEIIDGVHIRRIPLLPEQNRGFTKFINSGLFLLMVFFRLLFGKRSDLYWTATMPPVIQALIMMSLAKIRRAKFLYHMQDIYPEIGEVSGNFSKYFPVTLLKKLDTWVQKKSAAIVLLSEDMKNSVAARGVDPECITIINNFPLVTLDDDQKKVVPKTELSDDVTKFVFAGNIGRFQNLDRLVNVFGNLQNAPVELTLIGEGRMKASLQHKVKERGIKNVKFVDHLPVDEAFRAIRDMHVAVVSLQPEIYRFAFPSKILTYLAANLPILAMVEDESAIASLLDREKLGRNVPWNATDERLTDSIMAFVEERRDHTAKPIDAVHLYHPDVARTKWLALLNTLHSDVEAKAN